ARQHHFPVRKKAAPAPAPELEGASSAVVWLNRPLPDPTPPALRLKVRFAKHLRGVARADRVDWALMLGVLRAEGHNGAAPANLAGLRGIAAQLSSQAGSRMTSPWAEMFSFSRDASFADRAGRHVLLLAHELMPRLVISLLGLGGPSFPLANHYDHIHIGY